MLSYSLSVVRPHSLTNHIWRISTPFPSWRWCVVSWQPGPLMLRAGAGWVNGRRGSTPGRSERAALSQTGMCVTAAGALSRGVRPSWFILPSDEGRGCWGFVLGSPAQRNVSLHTQWWVMGTVCDVCNCSLGRALSRVMATCMSMEERQYMHCRKFSVFFLPFVAIQASYKQSYVVLTMAPVHFRAVSWIKAIRGMISTFLCCDYSNFVCSHYKIIIKHWLEQHKEYKW